MDINDIKDSYNASKHPDVVSGKREAESVLVEFLETFETHHNLKEGGQNDGRVTLEEFTEYYNNISISIVSVTGPANYRTVLGALASGEKKAV